MDPQQCSMRKHTKVGVSLEGEGRGGAARDGTRIRTTLSLENVGRECENVPPTKMRFGKSKHLVINESIYVMHKQRKRQ